MAFLVDDDYVVEGVGGAQETDGLGEVKRRQHMAAL